MARNYKSTSQVWFLNLLLSLFHTSPIKRLLHKQSLPVNFQSLLQFMGLFLLSGDFFFYFLFFFAVLACQVFAVV